MARKLVRETLTALLLPRDLVDDAVTMVSELATNVFAHVLGGRTPGAMPTAGLPELQIYGREAEVVVRVFDSASWCGTVPDRANLRPPVEAEGGRGLELVNALAVDHGGHWGAQRSRSRLGLAPVSGKVVYFALPVPVPVPWRPLRRDCHEAARELRRLLAARGIGPLHLSEGWRMAVLSVRAEITVWARDETFFVTLPAAGAVCRPLSDVVDVAEGIVRCNEDLDALGR